MNFFSFKIYPKSKRKSELLGMVTVFSIFGITLLGSSLPAIAKDVPVPDPNSSSAPISPTPKKSNELWLRIST